MITCSAELTVQAFSLSMQRSLGQDTIPVDFYTAPISAPASIEGNVDSIVSAAAVLADLQGRWDEWDGVGSDTESQLIPVCGSVLLSSSTRPSSTRTDDFTGGGYSRRSATPRIASLPDRRYSDDFSRVGAAARA